MSLVFVPTLGSMIGKTGALNAKARERLAAAEIGDLDTIAPVITMFFLITYAMLNLVVLIEQSMGLVSFRPLFRVPRWVSAAGLIGSTVTMFIIHPLFSLTAVAVVLFFYVLLLRRRLAAPFGDMRSGLFVTTAEWAAKKVALLPQQQERAWKPNILVPVEDPRTVRGSFQLLHDIVDAVTTGGREVGDEPLLKRRTLIVHVERNTHWKTRRTISACWDIRLSKRPWPQRDTGDSVLPSGRATTSCCRGTPGIPPLTTSGIILSRLRTSAHGGTM